MKVDYSRETKQITVTLDKPEAERITAFIAYHLKLVVTDYKSTVPSRLEAAFTRVLT